MSETQHAPICLRAMGSFHVGGRTVRLENQPRCERVMSAGGQPVSLDFNGTYLVEQMYVQYFLPERANGQGPLVFWHGGAMTGAAWETTPDGREGWANYFLRQGWDVYLCDAVERGRSGFAPYPEIWPEKPVIQTVDDIFSRFRIGEKSGSYDPDPARRAAYANTRFPLGAFDQFAKQMVPRWTHTDAAIIQGFGALLEKIGPATILCHSQAGPLALQLTLAAPGLLRRLVAVEPAGIPEADFDCYCVPTLIVLGDNIDSDRRWTVLQDKIRRFSQAVAPVTVLSLPEHGIHGNSHVMMMDTNNLQIAALIDHWMQENDAIR